MYLTIDSMVPQEKTNHDAIWDVEVKGDEFYLHPSIDPSRKAYSLRNTWINLMPIMNSPNTGQVSKTEAWTAYVLASLALKCQEHVTPMDVSYILSVHGGQDDHHVELSIPRFNSKVVFSGIIYGESIRRRMVEWAAYAVMTVEESFPDDIVAQTVWNINDHYDLSTLQQIDDVDPKDAENVEKGTLTENMSVFLETLERYMSNDVLRDRISCGKTYMVLKDYTPEQLSAVVVWTYGGFTIYTGGENYTGIAYACCDITSTDHPQTPEETAEFFKGCLKDLYHDKSSLQKDL